MLFIVPKHRIYFISMKNQVSPFTRITTPLQNHWAQRKLTARWNRPLESLRWYLLWNIEENLIVGEPESESLDQKCSQCRFDDVEYLIVLTAKLSRM